MKAKHLTLFLFIFVAPMFGPVFPSSSLAEGGSQTLTAEFGPPSTASQWETINVALEAESFEVDVDTFYQAMASIQTLRISFEMHTGYDQGGIDSVNIGSVYSSTFDVGHEKWTSGGDGTMIWQASGGDDSGYLHIEDWASGDWHYAVAPAHWSGDWRALIGSYLNFSVMTDRPSYEGRIELISGPVADQLYLGADTFRIAPGDSVRMSVTLPLVVDSDLEVKISSSSSAFDVPSSVIISAETDNAQFIAVATSDASVGDTSTIEVWGNGYRASRITLTVTEQTEDSVVDTPDSDTSCTSDSIFMSSTFNEDDEEWRPGNDVTLSWQPSGGDNGGYLQGNDWGDGRVWYFVSPSSWSGNWSDFSVLRFSLRLDSSSSSLFTDKDLIIKGANGGELSWSAEAAPSNTWTSYEIALTPETFAVSAEEYDLVISDVTEIWIRGEFISGGDQEGLDSVEVITKTYDAACSDPGPGGDLVCSYLGQGDGAVYNGLTGQLILSSVDAGGVYYDVTMTLVSAPFNFQITDYEVIGAVSEPSGVFDGFSGELTIPRVVTGGAVYSVILEIIDPLDLIFTLTYAEEVIP